MMSRALITSTSNVLPSSRVSESSWPSASAISEVPEPTCPTTAKTSSWDAAPVTIVRDVASADLDPPCEPGEEPDEGAATMINNHSPTNQQSTIALPGSSREK